MYFSIVKQYIKMLSNLSNFIDQAVQFSEDKKFDVNILLNDRLAPDQYPFLKQVQICCDSPKFLAARFAGKEAPKHDDTEKTVEELKNRINSTIEYLKTFTEEDFKDTDSRKMELNFMPGKYLTAQEYVFEFSFPNFYFHLTTAYSILRHNGVALGKQAFIGSLSLKDL